jgi:anti-sigma factor RsiW
MAVVMARLALGHPSRKRLATWLDASDASNTVTSHVETCERCAHRLEELAAVSSADSTLDAMLDVGIGQALREAYAAPEGIEDRVLRSIDARERADREMSLLLGILAIAKDTAELMLPADTDPARSDEHREEPS